MIEHIKYPKILSYGNSVKEIQHFCNKSNTPLPTIEYTGSTKLHGTNSAIVFSPNDIHFQSRKRILSITSDNAGFMNWGINNVGQDIWEDLRDTLVRTIGLNRKTDVVRVFGEFVGQGIHKGVAITNLPKSFFILSICIDDVGWIEPHNFSGVCYPDHNIHNIHQYTKYGITVDFSKPAEYVDVLENLSSEVGKRCPVAAEFGFNGPGEGIVWCSRYTNHRFKVVSDNYKEVTGNRVKKNNPRERTPLEIHVNNCINEARMRKVLDTMFEFNTKLIPENTKEALSILAQDIWNEERLILESMGGSFEDVKSKVGKGGRIYNQMIKNMV